MKQDGRMRVVDQSSHSKLSMVVVAQLVRASDCGSEGREFDSPQSPNRMLLQIVTNKIKKSLTHIGKASYIVSIIINTKL